MVTLSNSPVFILPWLIVPALNVRRALRLGIYFTFLLGTINIAVCLVRFIAIQQAGEDYSISLSTIGTFLQPSPTCRADFNTSQSFGAPSMSMSASSSPASPPSDPTLAPEEVQDIRPKTHKPNQQQQEDNPRLGSKCTTPDQWDILKMLPCQQARAYGIPLSRTRRRFGTMGKGITRVMSS